ncbi:MAG: helicase-exonuclease AddAB subunit AddA [Planctomycetia bacterium]|nr:helicase-exonuclease AddAB subunit AddA [Planctomycetia bacterium]
MSEIRWTPSQQAALDAMGGSILVSAAAGSGKTAVLAERCARLIADEKRPCGVDRLLVVTFTDAAAAEMRSRIGAALRSRLERSPSHARLQGQLALLDSAHISTLHSFCRRLLARFFPQADLDPQVPILNPADARLMRQEAVEAVFDDYEGKKDADAEAFFDFLSAYGGASERLLMKLIQQLDEFLASLPDPQAWIAQANKRMGSSGDALSLFWLEWLLGELQEELSLQSTLLADYIRMLSDWPSSATASADCLREYAAALASWQSSLGTIPDAAKVDDFCLRLIPDFQFPSPPRKGKKFNDLSEVDKQAFIDAAELVRKIKKDLFETRLKKPFGRFSVTDWGEGIDRTRSNVALLFQLAVDFRARYQAAKAELGVLDFTDLERRALALLADEANGVAARLRDQFEHVLVDEFQDINPVQAEILRLVSRETIAPRPANMFTVGDVKQSIYRFRLAEPRLFLDRRAAFLAAAGKPESRGVAIDLADNFRSRPILLDAVNAIFERLMTPELGGIAYDDSAKLRPGRKETDFRPAVGPPLELHLLEDFASAASDDAHDTEDATEDSGAAELVRIEREAMVCAERIKDCIAQGYEYGDIVILMRSMQARAGLFIRTLVRCGIPVFSDTSGGLFEALEAQDVLSLLAVIDNPLQDIPLAAILRSPLFGTPLNDSELVEIRRSPKASPPGVAFCEAVWTCADSGADAALRTRLARIRDQIDKWRQRARHRPLAETIWDIYEESGYLAYVSGLRDGLQRRANLIRIHEYARQFGSFRKQGLLRFLQFIDGVRAMGEDLEPGSVMTGPQDVVRVMTIHRSKGLEYPVVIVAELGKRFNLSDCRGSILFDRELGVGMEAVDLKKRIRYESLPHRMVAEAVKRQSLAEELRVLYVAMTRAKERLIAIGTKRLSRIDEWRARLASHIGPLSVADRRSATSALDWVTQALACHPSAWADAKDNGSDERFFVRVYDAAEMGRWQLEPPVKADVASRLEKIAAFDKLDFSATAADADSGAWVKLIERRLTSTYPAQAMTRVPAVAAASVLKRRWNALEDADDPAHPWHSSQGAGTKREIDASRLRSPSFRSTEASIDQTQRGTWTHEFLQRVELTQPCDEANLQDQLASIIQAGDLLQVEGDQIDLAALAWFFTTDLGRRIRDSRVIVHREWPFVIGVDPARYDPAARQADRQDVMLVRGIVDCLFDSGDGLEILDYKTDRVTGEGVAQRAAAYAGQLRIYANAVEMTWGRPVHRLHLAFLTARQIVEVAPESATQVE